MTSALATMPTGESQRKRRRPPVSPPPPRRARHNHPTPTSLTQESDEAQPPTSTSEDVICRLTRVPQIPNHTSSSIVHHSASPSTPASQSSAREIEVLRSKIKQLEDQLVKAEQASAPSNVATSIWDSRANSTQIAGMFHVRREAPSEGEEPTMSRFIVHKTRVLGQSHWINGVAEFLDILEYLEPTLASGNSTALFDLQKCKYIGKLMKAQRTPPWPTIATNELPPKELADQLVDIYLHAFESRYRVLHVPSFKKDYEALWGSDSPPDMGFIIQVKLIMAIGAVLYDENYSLRTQSNHWVYEAQAWISEPDFKARLTLQFIQTSILLLIAREAVWVNGALIWISVGELLRTAVYMGLHRDPSFLPQRNTFVSEMRRRLWNTILELAVNTSIDSGGPPLLHMDDYDTHPPGNFDDEDITAEDPAPKPEGTFTQMSIPIALRKTLDARLAIVESLNGIGVHCSYEEALRLDTELRSSYKAICRTLQGYSSNTTSALSPSSSPSQFQIRALDFLIRRYLLALHTPFFPASLHKTSYAFTRKIVVDTALQLWCLVNPSKDIMTVRPHFPNQSSTPDYLARLALCGSGPLRTTTTQVCFLMAAELKRQLQEEDTIGPVPLRRDLLSVVEQSIEWTWKCLEAGETNTKGFLFLSLVNAQLHGLMRGISEEQFPALYVEAAEKAQSKAVALFEEKMSGHERDIQVELAGINDMACEDLPNLLGDWDFMVRFTMPFDFGYHC
ncbi:hypothetical protein N7478_011749 [Penicillium angulare]|uniref:uncharacterized protein n=1 Tax=Penicillium angulare TaxID=116970 RepID=UPI00254130E8|nr:uncharacterized protein N7478_011749 [Penicillium angulare]KAJ5261154.1 hypothetical protein N7478_011749 [Penicillium angulare]